MATILYLHIQYMITKFVYMPKILLILVLEDVARWHCYAELSYEAHENINLASADE